ncbi:flagellin [Rhizobium laguerreae]|uniref:flagellin N-terminal helical domain-containing protein n=1 Tax=Rhizobium laguerreae TaxID=1076926 RepID=UPI001C906D44|nr:flagellin [Rhizobium laguerreae]MBY3155405.1 flagellin [Rhizobium laguerreae]
MSSILNNTSATNALKTLRQINGNLAKAQDQISTGLKINSSKDGAAFWSIATTMRSDIKALDTVNSLLGIGAAKVDTAQVGTDDAIDTTQKIRDLLVSAKEGSADKTLIQTQITQLQANLVNTAKASSYNGVNMLYKGATGAGAGVQNITSSVSRDASGNLATTSISVDSANTLLIDGATVANGILSKDRTGGNSNNYSVAGGSNNISLTATTTDSQLSDMIEAVEGALKDMTKSSSMLGSVSNRIDSSGEFAKKLQANLQSGVSRLVDTDMEEASAKLSALQTQQQLAVQALSIANSNNQNILSLFR